MALRFEELIERHHDEIFAYLWRLMGTDGRRDAATDVEDLTQDVFLRAYESFAGLRPNSNYRAWLYKIATHCAYTQWRRMKHRRDKLSFLKDSPTEPATVGRRFDLARRYRTKSARPGERVAGQAKGLRYPSLSSRPRLSRDRADSELLTGERSRQCLSGDSSAASRPGGRKMTTQKSKNEVLVVKHLRSALLSPTETTLSHSRERVKKWFTEEAPLIQWGEMSFAFGAALCRRKRAWALRPGLRAARERIFATLR